MGCHALLQGIFLTQRSNPGVLHCWQILDCLSHQGSLLLNALKNKFYLKIDFVLTWFKIQMPQRVYSNHSSVLMPVWRQPCYWFPNSLILYKNLYIFPPPHKLKHKIALAFLHLSFFHLENFTHNDPHFLWLCVILCMEEQTLHLPLMTIRLFQSVAITESVAVNNLVNISFLESARIPEGWSHRGRYWWEWPSALQSTHISLSHQPCVNRPVSTPTPAQCHTRCSSPLLFWWVTL